jgi:type II secretory pathway component PulK
MGSNRGIALMLVLWVMVVLILLAAGVAMLAHTETQISRNYGDVVQCKWAARAGVYAAMHQITSTILAESTTYLGEEAYTVGSDDSLGTTAVVSEDLGNCTFLATIEDESGKVNINGHGATAALDETSEATLTSLFGSQEIADAVMDWRNPDTRPSSEGAESSYYNTLSPPYNAKNAAFETVQELNLVKGITSDILTSSTTMGTTPLQDLITVYGPPATTTTTTTTTATSTKVDINGTAASLLTALQPTINSGDAQAIYRYGQSLPGRHYTNPAQVVNSNVARSKLEKIYDRLTATGAPAYTNLVNINTAPLEVLASMPGPSSGNPPILGTSIAQAILTYRAQQSSEGGFTGVGYLLAVNSVTNNAFIALAPYCTVRSRVFKIVSTGRLPLTATQATVTCVVQFGTDNQTSIKYWQE